MKSADNPAFTLNLSREAYDDLIHIQHYTYAEHGEKQWQAYSKKLDEALRFIQHHPKSGHVRDDLPTAYLAWNVEQHLLIYRIEKNFIFLVRVLHGRMNFTRHF